MDAKRQAIRNVMAGKFKNKRVFLDLRRDVLILDFRASTGMSIMDVSKLAKERASFLAEVASAEKRIGIRDDVTRDGDALADAYGAELGFVLTRWYKWDSIAEYYGEDLGDEYSTRDIVDELEAALAATGWKVTRK
jgi:hypothetical protein